MSDHKLMLLTGSSNRPLARAISDQLAPIAQRKVPLVDAAIGRFNNGEVQARVGESVRDADCFIIQSLCAGYFQGLRSSVNDSIMEMLVLIDALVRAGAHRVVTVTPIYAYARQDKKTKPREPITASMLARIIETVGSDRLMAVVLHSASIQGFFKGPVDNLSADVVLCDRLSQDHWAEDDCTVVSPDLGGTARADQLAERLGLPVATIVKRRPKPGVAEAVRVIGDVAGRRCLMFDDIIDTAGSIDAGAGLLKKEGASDICVAAAHGVFSRPAITRIYASENIARVYVTDTIPKPHHSIAVTEKRYGHAGRIVYVSVATLLAEAIWRNHIGESVHELFT